MNIFNENLCHSIKSKNTLHEQCNHKPKTNEKLCGKHLNAKNIVYFKKPEKIEINEIEDDEIDIEINDNIFDDNIFDDKKMVYSKRDLYNIISNDKYIGIYSIRNSIKNCDLCRLIDTKQSKNLLINDIKKIISKERYYLNNEQYVIFIQSLIRRWFVYRKKICCNDTDILTFSSKYEIPDIYFYSFYDNITKKNYAYDIRTLIQILNSEYKSCPYTFRSFTENEKNDIINKHNILIKNNINTIIEKEKFSPEEEINMKIKDIFYQINMLDNYTDHMWFKKLNLNQLTSYYIKMEDIWNYRISMNMESKKKIVKNGILFNIPSYVIQHQKDIIKMQHILLNEFSRMITEGINRDEKKLGALLILTGLVEISHEAYIALPHLVQ